MRHWSLKVFQVAQKPWQKSQRCQKLSNGYSSLSLLTFSLLHPLNLCVFTCRFSLSLAGGPSQTERHSPHLGLRSCPSLDGGKTRASVRMTRYLESWGAAKPFANLHHRDSMTADNGKINTTVGDLCLSRPVCLHLTGTQRPAGHWICFLFQDVPMGQYYFQRRERWGRDFSFSCHTQQAFTLFGLQTM